MPSKLYAGLTYEQAVQKYVRSVYGVCVMRLQNYADAEDCSQNVFVKLYSNSPDFANENHLKAWLIRVAVNECNKHIRKNRRLVSLDSVKEEKVEFPEEKYDISWALMKTPKKYRDVLYLHYCEKYKIKEIAIILNIKENSVKSLLKKGREILRTIYGGD